MSIKSWSINAVAVVFSQVEAVTRMDAVTYPSGFEKLKYGERTLGQLEALENKLTTPVVDAILADKLMVKIEGDTVVVTTKSRTPSPINFWARKMEEGADRVVFEYRIHQTNHTGRQFLEETGRTVYANLKIVERMPLVPVSLGGEFGRFVFFKPSGPLADSVVERERQARNLSQDWRVQILLNRTFPEFADKHPNGDSWLVDKRWARGDFDKRVNGQRSASIRFSGGDWDSCYWFGGRE